MEQEERKEAQERDKESDMRRDAWPIEDGAELAATE
jgi:hypothetical protein